MDRIGFKATFSREIRRMTSRKIYLYAIFLVPIAMTLFFVDLLDSGLPLKTPSGIVDLDHSELSRTVTRSLDAEELLDINYHLESYSKAMDHVRRGDIFGFFVIPANFETDALAGRTPTLEYYSNMTYFVPGTLSFKGFKTIAVGTSAGALRTTLISTGIDPQMIGPLIQPVSVDQHLIGNPWMNYSYYLSPSFLFGVLALMIMMITVYSITTEIKMHTSPLWIAVAGGKMRIALSAKLLPYTILFVIVGIAMLAILLGFRHFPVNGTVGNIVVAMILFVPACQCFAAFVCTIVPNPRLALSVVCLIGVLTFSFAGFSFPVDKMYGSIAILSYIVPVRYLFEIYTNEAILGAPAFYSRWFFLALVAFYPLPALLSRRLKNACLKPIYVP